MQEIKQGLDVILTFPFLVVSLVVVAISTTVRGTLGKLRPTWERSKWYKAAFPWFVLLLGVGMALVARGMGQFSASWGYVVLLGILAGFFSSFLWNALKQFIKAWVVRGK